VSALTPRQRKILAVIRWAVKDRGYPPTLREIGEAVGLASLSSVSYQLDELVAKGAISRVPGQPRAIRVLDPVVEMVPNEITEDVA
jgi:repressor LexA